MSKRTRLRGLRFENLEARRLLAADLGSFHNVADPEDVNADGSVNVADAFIAIDEVRGRRAGEIRKLADVDADGRVSVKDALHVIDRLRKGGETTLPLEKRIERLSNAIANETLPSQVSTENAQILLGRLQARLTEIQQNPNSDPLELAERLARRFNRLDVDGDGRLSDGEVSGEGEGFAEVLENAPRHDGHILSEDFISSLEEHFESLGERWDNPQDAFAVFDFLDVNDDGGLSENEAPTPEVWEALAPADANNDESLTEEELIDYARQLLDEQVESLFDLLDASHNGVLDQTDVAPIAWFFLSRADENTDGVVSLEEFRALPSLIIDRLTSDRE